VSARSLSPETRAQLAAFANRRLSDEEWRAQSEIPLTPEELEHTLSLVRWFRAPSPDAASRLAYARRAYTRWTRGQR
jgi:hypothetical protein